MVFITAFWPQDVVAKMTARRLSSRKSVVAAKIHGNDSFCRAGPEYSTIEIFVSWVNIRFSILGF